MKIEFSKVIDENTGVYTGGVAETRITTVGGIVGKIDELIVDFE